MAFTIVTKDDRITVKFKAGPEDPDPSIAIARPLSFEGLRAFHKNTQKGGEDTKLSDDEAADVISQIIDECFVSGKNWLSINGEKIEITAEDFHGAGPGIQAHFVTTVVNESLKILGVESLGKSEDI